MPLSRKVWEFMVKEPNTVDPSDTLQKALIMLNEVRKESPGVQSLIVADQKSRQLRGVVTLRRIMAGLRRSIGFAPGSTDQAFWERTDAVERIREQSGSMTVGEVMSKRIHQVKPYDTIARALNIMLEHKVRGLPVVESERVIGVIRLNDIFPHLYDSIVTRR